MSWTRDEKKAARLAKKIAKAERLTEKLGGAAVVKEAVITSQTLESKKPININSRPEFLSKKPVFNTNPSTYQAAMTWCASIADVADSWSWREARQWTEQEWESEICSKLDSFEGTKWSEIVAMTTGSGRRRKARRKLNHSQEIHTLDPEAQERWRELNLEQFDTAFRFRFGGTKRSWGIQHGSHFYLIWFERKHKIYPI